MRAPDPHRWRAIPAKPKRGSGLPLLLAFGGLLIVLALLIATLTVGAQS